MEVIMKSEKNNYLKKVFFHSVYDLKGMETFLEEMAVQGYMFVKQIGFVFYFKKCEPKKLRFCVDVFGKASIFDTRPETATQEYIAYCEECGWQHLFTKGKLQFFCTDNMEATSIQTDDQLRMKLIHVQTMANYGITWILLTAAIVLQLVKTFMSYNLAEILIQNTAVILLLILWPLIILPQVMRYIYFYIKNKRRIEKGEEMFFYNRKQISVFHRTELSIVAIILAVLTATMYSGDFKFGILMIILMVLSVVIFWGMDNFYAKNGSSRFDNMVLTIVCSMGGVCLVNAFILVIILIEPFDGGNSEIISYYDQKEYAYVTQIIEHDTIPITLEKIGLAKEDEKYNNTISYLYRTIFGTYDSYEQYLYNDEMNTISYLEYDIVKSSFPFILKSYVMDCLRSEYYTVEDNSAQEAAACGAVSVYAIYEKEEEREGRLIVFTDCVIKLVTDSLNTSNETTKRIVELIKP